MGICIDIVNVFALFLCHFQVNKEKDDSRDVNFDANPLYLKSTEKGSEVRTQGNLARPVTNIRATVAEDEDSNLAWKKPDWAKEGPKLKSTGKGDAVKSGGYISKPVTNIREVAEKEEDNLAWKKPDWAKTGPQLKSTGKGDAVKSGGYISKPVTNIAEVTQQEKNLAWEKPAWAKDGPKLKSTSKGQKLKEKGDLARPITFRTYLLNAFYLVHVSVNYCIVTNARYFSFLMNAFCFDNFSQREKLKILASFLLSNKMCIILGRRC